MKILVGGIFYGWPAYVFVLKEEEIFYDLCENTTDSLYRSASSFKFNNSVAANEVKVTFLITPIYLFSIKSLKCFFSEVILKLIDSMFPVRLNNIRIFLTENTWMFRKLLRSLN